jgi:hypothetical protein
MRREARLRPEYAHLYPMLEAGKWELAALAAEKVAATRLLQLVDTFVFHERVLADIHFEFRGGSPRRADSGSDPGQPQSVMRNGERNTPAQA